MPLGVGGHYLVVVADGLPVVLVVVELVDRYPVLLVFDDHSVILAVVVLPVALVVGRCHVVHVFVENSVILVVRVCPVIRVVG